MTLPQFKQDDTQSQTQNDVNAVDSFDEPVRRVPKAVKWLAGTAVGLVLVAGIGGIVATQLIDQQKYKALVVSKVEEATGYSVDWDGNINLGMMPLPHASVSKLSVKANGTEILTVAKADIQVALMPLLSKKVEIKNISIDEPVVTLLTTRAGVKTWEATPKAATTEVKQADAGASNEASSDFEVVVNSIEINDGSFVIDNQKAKSRQEFKDLNLNIRADSLKGPFDVSGETEWSGQKIKLEATSGEINTAEGSYPIQAKVSLPSSDVDFSFSGVVDTQNMGAKGDVNLNIADVAKAGKNITGTAPSLPEGIGGKASLAGKLVYSANRVAIDDMALSLGTLAYSGQVAADGLSGGAQPLLSFQLQPTAKANGDAPQVVQLLSDLTIAAKGSIENDKIQIVSANIKTKGNDVSVNGYSSLGDNPKVDLSIRASEINLDALSGKAAAADGQSPAGDGAKPAESGNFGFSVPFAGRVRADIDKLTTGGKTYSGIKADVTSEAGALTISSAEISLPQNTNVSVSGKIAKTEDLSGLSVKLSAKTQDTEEFLKSMNVTAPELPRKIGAAAVNGTFTGDLKNLGFNATVSALQFNVTGEGAVGDPLSAPAISSLKFNVKHPNFNEAMKTLQPGFSGSTGFFGAMDVSGQLSWGQDKVEVSGLNGKLGQTTVAGNVSAVTKPKTNIKGDLNLGAVVLPSATNNGGTVAATPRGGNVSSGGGDRWSRETIDTAWMRAFDADISIKAKSITQNMWKLNDANVAFKLNDGVLTLDDVSAGLFGGHASINGTIKSGAGAGDPLTINASLKAEQVDAQGLMSAAMGKPSYVLTGTLSDVDTSIKATGASAAALIKTLNGNGVMNGKDITVKGVDVVALSNAAGGSYKPLERLGALGKSMGGENQTSFDTFDSQFTIEDGVVNVKKAAFDNKDASLSSTGQVNLPLWTVNLDNKVILKSNEAEPINFKISGSLDNPAQSGMQNILMNRFDKLLNKKDTKLNKALGKFLGGGEAAQPEAPAVDPNAAPAAQDAVPVEPQPAEKVNVKDEAAKEAVKALEGLFGK